MPSPNPSPKPTTTDRLAAHLKAMGEAIIDLTARTEACETLLAALLDAIPEPAATPPPAAAVTVALPPATAEQLDAIKHLSAAVDQVAPAYPLTFAEAAALIDQLGRKSRERRKTG